MPSGVIDLRAALAGSTNPHDLTVAMRLRGLETSRGPAEFRGNEAVGQSTLSTLVQQLNAEPPPAPPAAEPAPEPEPPTEVLAEEPAAAPARRRRRTPRS